MRKMVLRSTGAVVGSCCNPFYSGDNSSPALASPFDVSVAGKLDLHLALALCCGLS